MIIQVVTLSTEEMQIVIADAYKEGYIKAQREWEIEKSAKIEEPKFAEIIRGVKELRQYLIYKGFWSGSVSTLSKVAPQLLESDKKGHGLIFHRTCIDYSFSTGFQFKTPIKKEKVLESISV